LSTYYYDHALARLEQLILQNIPYPDPDPQRVGWRLYSAKVGPQFFFLILGREELFGRKTIASLIVSDQHKSLRSRIYPAANHSQKEILNQAIIEITRRLPQISFEKEKNDCF